MPPPGPEDISAAEVYRRTDELKADLKADLAQIRHEIMQLGRRVESRTVNMDYYKIAHSALQDTVHRVEAKVDSQFAAAERREELIKANRRSVVLAVYTSSIALIGVTLDIISRHVH